MDGKLFDTVYNLYNSIPTLFMSITIFTFCSGLKLNNGKFNRVIESIISNTLGIYFIHVPIGIWLTDVYKHAGLTNFFLFDLVYAFLYCCYRMSSLY